MAAAAHNPDYAKRMGIPVTVAKEFNQADKRRGMFKNYDKHGHPRSR